MAMLNSQMVSPTWGSHNTFVEWGNGDHHRPSVEARCLRFIPRIVTQQDLGGLARPGVDKKDLSTFLLYWLFNILLYYRDIYIYTHNII